MNLIIDLTITMLVTVTIFFSTLLLLAEDLIGARNWGHFSKKLYITIRKMNIIIISFSSA